jgi:hypothetical protein
VPEPVFAARVTLPGPERPFPATRRAIFFDVENTSRAQHIARVIDYLAIDRLGSRTEFLAVGNWRVIGHDTARLLASHGADLVHSAPSVGVRDWSDLRIAVGAGVWLAAARPGDSIEIVSDDRAFDAVGDVAASLGIVFRRLSYRGLAGMPGGEAPARPSEPVREAAPRGEASSRRRWRERGRGPRAAAPRAPVAPAAARARAVAPPETDGGGEGEPRTAPHDEILAVMRDLVHEAPGRGVSIDTFANALKARGFRRTSGSPRLITRLRRIKELVLNRAGMITLVGAGPVEPGGDESAAEPREALAGAPEGDGREIEAPRLEVLEREAPESDAPEPGNERGPGEDGAGQPTPPPRRRSRRGGRRHRRRGEAGGGGQPG